MMDIDIRELVKAAAESFNLKDFKGDVVGVKIVENQCRSFFYHKQT